MSTGQLSQTERLAWILFPVSFLHQRRQLGVFAVYFDDSGTDDQAKVAALAGYLARVEIWEAFAGDWNAFLDRLCIPFYHATDCAGGHGFFARWDAVTRNAAHREAVEIITRHRLVAMGVSVAAQEFVKDFRQWVPPERQHRKPQLVYCFERVLVATGSYLRAYHPSHQTGVVLEHSPKITGIVGDAYEEFLGGPHRELKRYFSGTPVLHPKLGFPQVQAADVLAYELTLDAQRAFYPPRAFPERDSWIALYRHCEAYGGTLTHYGYGPGEGWLGGVR